MALPSTIHRLAFVVSFRPPPPGCLLRRLRLPRVAFWALVAVLASLLMLGDATPLSRLIYRVPVLNLFRRPRATPSSGRSPSQSSPPTARTLPARSHETDCGGCSKARACAGRWWQLSLRLRCLWRARGSLRAGTRRRTGSLTSAIPWRRPRRVTSVGNSPSRSRSWPRSPPRGWSRGAQRAPREQTLRRRSRGVARPHDPLVAGHGQDRRAFNSALALDALAAKLSRDEEPRLRARQLGRR
jgi:hypothetical protein